MAKIKDPLGIAGNSPINVGKSIEYSDVQEAIRKVKGMINDTISISEQSNTSEIHDSIDVKESINDFVSTTESKEQLELKTMVEQLKDKLSEGELVDILVKHARNTSATIAKPYIFFLCEKYGLGIESGGFGGHVESSFIGIEKSEDWEEGE